MKNEENVKKRRLIHLYSISRSSVHVLTVALVDNFPYLFSTYSTFSVKNPEKMRIRPTLNNDKSFNSSFIVPSLCVTIIALEIIIQHIVEAFLQLSFISCLQ